MKAHTAQGDAILAYLKSIGKGGLLVGDKKGGFFVVSPDRFSADQIDTLRKMTAAPAKPNPLAIRTPRSGKPVHRGTVYVAASARVVIVSDDVDHVQERAIR